MKGFKTIILIITFLVSIVSEIFAINAIDISTILPYAKEHVIKPVTINTPVEVTKKFKFQFKCSPDKDVEKNYVYICDAWDNLTTTEYDFADNKTYEKTTSVCVKGHLEYNGKEISTGIKCEQTNIDEEKEVMDMVTNDGCLAFYFQYHKPLDNFVDYPVTSGFTGFDSGDMVPYIELITQFYPDKTKLSDYACSYTKYDKDGNVVIKETYNCGKPTDEKISFLSQYAIGIICPEDDSFHALGGTYNIDISNFNLLNFNTNLDDLFNPDANDFLLLTGKETPDFTFSEDNTNNKFFILNSYKMVQRFPVPVDRYWNYINARNEGEGGGKVKDVAERRINFTGPSFVFMPVVPFWGYVKNKTPHSAIGFAPAKPINMDIVYPPDAKIMQSKWLNIDEFGNTFGDDTDNVPATTSVWEVRPFLSVVIHSDNNSFYKKKSVDATYKITIDHGGFEDYKTIEYDNGSFDFKKVFVKEYTVYSNKLSKLAGADLGQFDVDHNAPVIYYALGPRIFSNGYEGIAHLTAEITDCPDAPELIGKRAVFSIKMTSKLIEISADKDNIKPDGKSEINVTVTLKDLNKGAIKGKSIGIILNQGKAVFNSLITDSNGQIKGKILLPPEKFKGEKHINFEAIAFFDNISVSASKIFKVGESYHLNVKRTGDNSGNITVLPNSGVNIVSDLTNSDNEHSLINCPVKITVSGLADIEGNQSINSLTNKIFQLNVFDNASIGDEIVIAANVIDNSSTPEICYDNNGKPLSDTLTLNVGNILLNITSPVPDEKVKSNYVILKGTLTTNTGNLPPDNLTITLKVSYSNKNYLNMGKYLPEDSEETFDNLQLIPDTDTNGKILNIKGPDGNDFKIPVKNLFNDITLLIKDSSGTIRAKYHAEIISSFYLNIGMALKYLTELQNNALKFKYNLPAIADIFKALNDIKSKFSQVEDNVAQKDSALSERLKYVFALFSFTMRLLEVNDNGEITIFDAISDDISSFITISDILSAADFIKNPAIKKVFDKMSVENITSEALSLKTKKLLLDNIDKNIENISINTKKVEEYIKLSSNAGVKDYDIFIKNHLLHIDAKDFNTLKIKIEILKLKTDEPVVNSIKNLYESVEKNSNIFSNYYYTLNNNPFLQNIVNEHFKDNIFKQLNNELIQILKNIKFPVSSTDTSNLKDNAHKAYNAIRESSVNLLSFYRAFHYGAKTLADSLQEAGNWTSVLVPGYGQAVSKIEIGTGLIIKYASTIGSFIKLSNQIDYILNTLLKKGIDSFLYPTIKFSPNDPNNPIDYHLIEKYTNLKNYINSGNYNEILDAGIALYNELDNVTEKEHILISKADAIDVLPRGSTVYLKPFASIYEQSWLVAKFWRKKLLENLDNYIFTGDSSYLEKISDILHYVIDSENALEEASNNFSYILQDAYFDDLIMISGINNEILLTGMESTLSATIENIGEKSAENLSAHLLITDYTGKIINEQNLDLDSIEPHSSTDANFSISFTEQGIYNGYLLITDDNGTIKALSTIRLTSTLPDLSLNVDNATEQMKVDKNLTFTLTASDNLNFYFSPFFGNYLNKPSDSLIPLKSFFITTSDSNGNLNDNNSLMQINLNYHIPFGNYDNYVIGYYNMATKQWSFLNTTNEIATGNITAILPYLTGYYTLFYKTDEIPYAYSTLYDNNSCVYFAWLPPDSNIATGVSISVSFDSGNTFQTIADNINGDNYTYCDNTTSFESAYFKFQINFNNGTKSSGIILKDNISNENNPSLQCYADNVSGYAPLSVKFKCFPSDKNDIVKYMWDFKGQGTIDSITDDNATTFSYSNPGLYNVTVKAIDNNSVKLTSNTIVISVLSSSTSFNLNISKGWNLISIPTDNSYLTGEIFQKALTVWSWSGDTWLIWSPEKNITDLLTYYKIKTIEKLQPAKGYWINATENFSENFSGSSYGMEQLIINSGWNLCGTGKTLNVNKFQDVNTIWKWNKESNNWQIWSPELKIMKLISKYGLKSITDIEKGEGFWVNK